MKEENKTNEGRKSDRHIDAHSYPEGTTINLEACEINIHASVLTAESLKDEQEPSPTVALMKDLESGAVPIVRPITLAVLKQLKNECKLIDCKSCNLFNDEYGCILSGLPEDWPLDEYNKIDKNAERAIPY